MVVSGGIKSLGSVWFLKCMNSGVKISTDGPT